ncbi:GNAT family N-acetyltransferase [Gillisia marina]|uniref:GNAT family N-acetyltransferase n=1 Tax=Gillisia marina TaxID=1167637 RepID=UPI00029AAA7D|nr:GNAT family protein [Gillisia marina]
MQEAMPLICEYGFKKLELERIEGLVESENLNCKRALEKMDWTFEGMNKNCELKNGNLISIDTYFKQKKE